MTGQRGGTHSAPRNGATWPAHNALSEAELLVGYGLGPPVTPDDHMTAGVAPRRRPSPTRPGDRGGPLCHATAAARRGPGPGAPVRLIVNAPGPWAVTPWLRWLRAKGWHVHVVGRAAYAHHPEVPGLPGWLVGFAVVGEPPPAWLRWLVVHRTREVRRPARQAVTT
jgi:hypothetical protein